MTAPKVYADATALIGLGRIDRLDLLALLPTPIYVTTHVWAEVSSGAEKPGVPALQRAREAGLLAVVDEGDPNGFPQLDGGESSVLTAASAARAAVLIDERKARAAIDTDANLKATIREGIGIIGLIVLAKRRGHVAAVRPLLDELIQHRFWIGPGFYQDILRQVGEW